MFVVAFELNAHGGCTDNPSEEREFLVVRVAPPGDLNLEFLFLGELVAEPH